MVGALSLQGIADSISLGAPVSSARAPAPMLAQDKAASADMVLPPPPGAAPAASTSAAPQQSNATTAPTAASPMPLRQPLAAAAAIPLAAAPQLQPRNASVDAGTVRAHAAAVPAHAPDAAPW